jgi:hypothetical protein
MNCWEDGLLDDICANIVLQHFLFYAAWIQEMNKTQVSMCMGLRTCCLWTTHLRL